MFLSIFIFSIWYHCYVFALIFRYWYFMYYVILCNICISLPIFKFNFLNVFTFSVERIPEDNFCLPSNFQNSKPAGPLDHIFRPLVLCPLRYWKACFVGRNLRACVCVCVCIYVCMNVCAFMYVPKDVYRMKLEFWMLTFEIWFICMLLYEVCTRFWLALLSHM